MFSLTFLTVLSNGLLLIQAWRCPNYYSLVKSGIKNSQNDTDCEFWERCNFPKNEVQTASDYDLKLLGVQFDCVPEVIDCDSVDSATLYCSDDSAIFPEKTSITYCKPYSAFSNCVPLPLCMDALRSLTAESCEHICSDLLETLDCREIPFKGEPDPFRVIERIRKIKFFNKDFFEFFDAWNRKYNPSNTFITEQTIQPLEMCVTDNQHDCVPVCKEASCDESCRLNLPWCDKSKGGYLPFCKKYELDFTKIGTECIPRPLCIDRPYYLEANASTYRGFDFSEVCERLCDELDTVTMGTYKFNYGYTGSIPEEVTYATERDECRRRPVGGVDPWGVLIFDKSESRAFRWCETELLLFKPENSNCAPQPKCDDTGNAPQNFTVNPYYATGDNCVDYFICDPEVSHDHKCLITRLIVQEENKEFAKRLQDPAINFAVITTIYVITVIAAHFVVLIMHHRPS